MYGGRIRLVNRCRVPSSSTRRSCTRGARTCIVPAPQVTERGPRMAVADDQTPAVLGVRVEVLG